MAPVTRVMEDGVGQGGAQVFDALGSGQEGDGGDVVGTAFDERIASTMEPPVASIGSRTYT